MTTVEFRFHNGSRQVILRPTTSDDRQLLNLWRGERGSELAIVSTGDDSVVIEAREPVIEAREQDKGAAVWSRDE